MALSGRLVCAESGDMTTHRAVRTLHVTLIAAALVGGAWAVQVDDRAGAEAVEIGEAPGRAPADRGVTAGAASPATPASIAPAPRTEAGEDDALPAPAPTETHVPAPAPVAPTAPAPTAPAPTPSSSTPPPTAPPTTAAPAPTSTAPPTTGAPAPVSDLERATSALHASVPATWRSAVPHQLTIIDGPYSRASTNGLISISSTHARGSWDVLRMVVAHEFGHLIAFRYGTGEFLGAGPAGWPYSGPQPEEMWADCVATAFTGLTLSSHGLSPCPASTLDWTRAWLSNGPPG
jgi:hypothetical protein